MFSTFSSRNNLKSNSFSPFSIQYCDTYCVTLSFPANFKLQLMQLESLKLCFQQNLTAWRLSTSKYFIAPQTTLYQECFCSIHMLQKYSLSSFVRILILSETPEWNTWEISEDTLGQHHVLPFPLDFALWMQCPGSDPSLPTLTLLADRTMWAAERALTLCESCSAITNTSLH